MNKLPTAKVIEHSVTLESELVTFQLRYPRLIHSELMTHRQFSRNASSSRAIPVAKMIEQVRTDPASPFKWTENKAGMQGDVITDPERIAECDALWIKAANSAADLAEEFMLKGIHKQCVNRLLEPFQWISVVLTTSELENWFELRDHPAADPTIQALAVAMREALLESSPRHLESNQWHLPYITEKERKMLPVEDLLRMSAARCARVSYLRHDGTTSTLEEDIALFNRLIMEKPMHASPIEHQARVALDSEEGKGLSGNFGKQWTQHRKLVEKRLVTYQEL